MTLRNLKSVKIAQKGSKTEENLFLQKRPQLFFRYRPQFFMASFWKSCFLTSKTDDRHVINYRHIFFSLPKSTPILTVFDESVSFTHSKRKLHASKAINSRLEFSCGQYEKNEFGSLNEARFISTSNGTIRRAHARIPGTSISVPSKTSDRPKTVFYGVL